LRLTIGRAQGWKSGRERGGKKHIALDRPVLLLGDKKKKSYRKLHSSTHNREVLKTKIKKKEAV